MGDIVGVGRFTIPDNAAVSNEVDLRGFHLRALIIPDAWIAADVRFESKTHETGRGIEDQTDFLQTPLVLSVDATGGQYRLLTSDEAGAADGLWVTRIRSVSAGDPDVDVNQTGGPLTIVAVGHPRK